MNGPLKFLTARKILPLLDLLANLNECSLARAPQIFALLASSQSKFFISAHPRRKIAVFGMLAKARKDHSSPLIVSRETGYESQQTSMLKANDGSSLTVHNLLFYVQKL